MTAVIDCFARNPNFCKPAGIFTAARPSLVFLQPSTITGKFRMSLRNLIQYHQQKSPTYFVRDGSHVFVCWRRADPVDARAKEY